MTITAIPTTFQLSRRIAATIYRWTLPTCPCRLIVATDGKVGRPGRFPKELFRLVHNCQ